MIKPIPDESDERQRLYQRAISERKYYPIRGRWAISIRKDNVRKKQARRNSRLMNSRVV